MPGRGPDIELIARDRCGARIFRAPPIALPAGALAFALFLGVPPGQPLGELRAQGTAQSVPAVKGFLQGGGVGSSMGGEAALLLSAGAGIHLGRGIRVWGEGRAMTRELEPSGSRPSLLRFGYGGVGMEWRHRRGRVEPSAAVLAGAGHARVRNRFSGVEVASENSLVVEPSLALWTLPHSRWSAGVGGGYRWVSPVDRLPGVAPRGLRGWTVSILVRLQQRP